MAEKKSVQCPKCKSLDTYTTTILTTASMIDYDCKVCKARFKRRTPKATREKAAKLFGGLFN